MNIDAFKRDVALMQLGIGDLSLREENIYNFLKNELSDLIYYESDITLNGHSHIFFFRKVI